MSTHHGIDSDIEWGILARSTFWTLQAAALFGLFTLGAAMVGGGFAALLIACVTGFCAVYLLFRQIRAYVDQRVAEAVWESG